MLAAIEAQKIVPEAEEVGKGDGGNRCVALELRVSQGKQAERCYRRRLAREQREMTAQRSHIGASRAAIGFRKCAEVEDGIEIDVCRRDDRDGEQDDEGQAEQEGGKHV